MIHLLFFVLLVIFYSSVHSESYIEQYYDDSWKGEIGSSMDQSGDSVPNDILEYPFVEPLFFDCVFDLNCNPVKPCCALFIESCLKSACAISGKQIDIEVITSCVESWNIQSVENLCLDDKSNDVFLYVPVSSETTYKTYRNIYCALCNREVNFTAWEITSNVPFYDNNWNCSNLYPCELEFDPPSFIVESGKLLHCNITTIDLCVNHIYYDNCKLYFKNSLSVHSKEYDFDRYEVLTKVRLQKVGRLEMEIRRDLLILAYKECVVPNKLNRTDMLDVGGSPHIGIYRFTMLLNLDYKKGGSIPDNIERCPSLHVYDPWKKQCRNVVCPNSGIYYDGMCYNDSQEILKNTTCPYVVYKDNEFILKENGTIYLLEMESPLKSKDYIKINESTILVCIDSNTNNAEKLGKENGLVTLICSIVSLFCLFTKIVLYIISKNPRKISETVICYLSFSLFVAQLLFLTSNNFRKIYPACATFAVLVHYAFLASTFWTNVLSYDIMCTFSTFGAKSFRLSPLRMRNYCIYGWIIPSLIVINAVFFDHLFPPTIVKPKYGMDLCWISNKMALLTFFAVPVVITLIINISLYIVTTMNILKLSRDSKAARKRCTVTERVTFFLYVKLALVMGLTWTIGFLAIFLSNDILWYCFDAFNGLQGVYILVAFTRFNFPCKNNMGWRKSNAKNKRISVVLPAT